MIGTLVGAGLGVASSLYGGVSASKAMKNVRDNLEEQKANNEAWYERRYNEDATQRADAQRLLQITQDNIRKRNREAAATAMMTGGTEESVAASKAANAKAMADAMSKIAADGEARKDSVEKAYMTRDAALDSQLNNMEVGKANAVTQAMQGAASAFGTAGTMADEYLDGRKKNE